MMVFDEKGIYLNCDFSRKDFHDEELLVQEKAIKNWRSEMLTFYNPQEMTIKQINRICHETDGMLKLFFQIAPTVQTLLGESEEMEVIGRVYDNGLLIFDSSSLLEKALDQIETIGPPISPLVQRKQFLCNNGNGHAIVYEKSLVYYIESIDYIHFLEDISNILFLSKHRNFKYFQNLEEQIIKQLNQVKGVICKRKESWTQFQQVMK